MKVVTWQGNAPVEVITAGEEVVVELVLNAMRKVIWPEIVQIRAIMTIDLLEIELVISAMKRATWPEIVQMVAVEEDVTCYNCNEEGHMSKDCPKPQRSRRGCRNCGEDGHIAAECTEPKKEGGDSNTCNRCKKEGHMSKDCTETVVDESGRTLVVPYIPPDNTSNESELFDDTHSERGINFDKYDKIKVTVNDKENYERLESFETDACIPLLLKKKDMMACAQTGSGKTAAFMIPIINYLIAADIEPKSYTESTQPVALVIAPTRELVIQIHQDATKFAWGSIVKCAKIYGGTTVGHALRELEKNGCHVLVATVGRLEDFVKRGKVSFERLEYLVLDEADRMLDMGFESSIKELLSHSTMPSIEKRQTLMFSATFPNNIQGLAKNFLKSDNDFVSAGEVGSANQDVDQSFEQVEKKEKKSRLVALLSQYVNDNKKVLVFVETKRQTDFLATYLSQSDIKTTSIHGDRLQKERETALNQFKSGEMKVLIATAVAARGLDIKAIDYVVNYDLPKEIEEYVHRIGRTGRVGNTGNAVSFYEPGRDEALLKPLMRILGQAMQTVPDWMQQEAQVGVGGFGGSYDDESSRDVRNHNTGYDNPSPNNDDDDGW
uniref:RNA helicase n=1 Tax=Strigamia maritima TaxID=126957 RepID=T1JNG1_STRMM